MRFAALLLVTVAFALQIPGAEDGPDALVQIENSANASFTANDYPAALRAWESAVTMARAAGLTSKLPVYFRRIGMSHSLLGQNEDALAAYREGIGAAEKAGDSEMLAENLHGAANILQRMGQFREALPLCEKEYALTEKAGKPDPMIRALNTWAQVLGQLGRIRELLPLQERAVELSSQSTQPGYRALSVANLAMYYGDFLGDYETALRTIKEMPTPTPNSLDAIARYQVKLNREAEAEASYRASLAASTAPGQWRIHAATLGNYGTLLLRRGNLAEARKNVEEYLALSLSHKDRTGTAYALAGLSKIALAEKNPGEAMRRAAEALPIARESESPEAIVEALVAQGCALDAAGRGQEAGNSFSEALSILESGRAESPASPASLQGEFDQWTATYQYAVSHEIRNGNSLAALRLADRAKARVLLDMLDRGKPGFDAVADPGERAGEQDARNRVALARRAAIAKPGPASKASLEEALRKEDDFNVRLYGRHPELLLQRAAPPDIRAGDLASLVPDGRTALLSYFILPDSVALFVVRAGDRAGIPSVQVFTLPAAGKLDALMRSFRSQIAARDLDYRVTARALFDALLGPASKALRGADRWILSPDGVLWDVPFQALMDAQGRHVLETRSLSYAPSLSVLRQLREKPAAPVGSRTALLTVANPDSEREANAIAALYGSGRATLLSGERATMTSFRQSAGAAEVIHIASHAETEPNHPLDSFLLFAPDRALTARDLLGIKLRANLVVLSACETARGRIGQGDGVMGLGWAVLAAGARASVLSQWKVDSGATSDLMIAFHKRLTAANPGAMADALRQASLETMRSPGRVHPFYWAGFIMVGDAR